MATQTLLFFVFISLFVYCYCDKLKCVQKSPCVCEYEDGRVIDLNPLAEKTAFNVSINNLTYYFHPCIDIKLQLPFNTTQNCSAATSLCLYNRTANSITNLGVAKDSAFSTSDTLNGVYEYVFPHSNVAIVLACTNIPNTVFYAQGGNSGITNLILFSHFACAVMHSYGMSTGSLLVILLLFFSLVYFTLGALVLYFLRGARGKEIIPNIDFWQDLPSLVRGGAVFLQNGCKPQLSNAETYDQI